ncbi:hypothetical protein PSA01_60610 [Pseudonocardia saturnea]|uniref:Uncharacterized protein n=1 Tax=Pseudonocardia saturnea TaxID=33909 RepID=A0ABQ0S804_9PSEU|nr:hypothetical protein Pdca_67600 [Pseudonocardia autotrophica]GEC29032.1 hypothetical protein PSA01_60610 [Pseudonocardia saturnea]
MDALSSQVDGLVEAAVRRPARAGDARWWRAALDRPACDLDDGWSRRAGPPVRRAGAARALGRPGQRVTQITHSGSPVSGSVLVPAALGALPGSRVPRSRRGRPTHRPPGSGVAGLLVSGAATGALLPGAWLSGLLGAGRVLPAAGPGVLLVLAGLVLLGGAGLAVRVRAARVARAREIAHRVRAAVLAAADRELIRRTLDAELAVGARPAPWRRVPRAAGVRRAA